MGALQPGLPNPSMLPQDWCLLIIDLKDCFFTILLHPQDTKRFAFTLPAINRGEPDKRFEWTTLPQGMRNSPMLCQLYVDAALQPLRVAWPDTIIYHYMDDILFAQPHPFKDDQIQYIEATLKQASLIIAPEKVQKISPWKYLGWTITQSLIRPQKLELQLDIKNLRDAQKLLGDLQWLKPIVGIPNTLLESLRPLLKGTDPAAVVTVTPEQRVTLGHVLRCVTEGFVQRRLPDVPLTLTVWHSSKHLLGALTQFEKNTEELRVLEWLSPPLQLRKTISTKMDQLAALIKKGRLRILEVIGTSPATIHLPIKNEDLDWFLLNSEELQEALLESNACILTGPLFPKQLQWLGEWQWIT